MTANPLEAPETKADIREMHRLLRQPLHSANAWLRMILGPRTYQKLMELQDEKTTHFIADKIHHHGQATPL